jgi:hypothetical protein
VEKKRREKKLFKKVTELKLKDINETKESLRVITKMSDENDVKEFSNFTRTFAFEAGQFMARYFTPGVVFLGSAGNILSVIVFLTTDLRKMSTSIYLAALGISDTCFLFGSFVAWLQFFDIDIYSKYFFCKFFTFMSVFCTFLSNWIIAAVTIERFTAVVYPLKRRTECTKEQACVVLARLFLFGPFICIPFAIFVSPRKYLENIDDYICDFADKNTVRFEVSDNFNQRSH